MGNTHLIKWGETLTSIARKYDTTVKELAKLNNIKNVDLIIAGKTLQLPVDSFERQTPVNNVPKGSAQQVQQQEQPVAQQPAQQVQQQEQPVAQQPAQQVQEQEQPVAQQPAQQVQEQEQPEAQQPAQAEVAKEKEECGGLTQQDIAELNAAVKSACADLDEFIANTEPTNTSVVTPMTSTSEPILQEDVVSEAGSTSEEESDLVTGDYGNFEGEFAYTPSLTLSNSDVTKATAGATLLTLGCGARNVYKKGWLNYKAATQNLDNELKQIDRVTKMANEAVDDAKEALNVAEIESSKLPDKIKTAEKTLQKVQRNIKSNNSAIAVVDKDINHLRKCLEETAATPVKPGTEAERLAKINDLKNRIKILEESKAARQANIKNLEIELANKTDELENLNRLKKNNAKLNEATKNLSNANKRVAKVQKAAKAAKRTATNGVAKAAGKVVSKAAVPISIATGAIEVGVAYKNGGTEAAAKQAVKSVTGAAAAWAGAKAGALALSWLGPWGAVAGGVIGGFAGYIAGEKLASKAID